MKQILPRLNGKPRTPGGSAELWAMAFPVIVATLSQSIMGMVDTFFMGRIGTVEQGAVGFSGIIFWTLTSLFVGTLQGVSTFAAQHHGAGRKRRCGRDGWLGLYVTLPSAVILGSVALLTEPILELMGSNREILPHATDYLSIRLAGALFVFVNYAVVAFLRGVGDTKTPMYFTLGANILNAVLNYALVLGHWGSPRLGASGAAIASVIATGVFSLAYLSCFLTGQRHRSYRTRHIRRPGFKETVAFLKVGAPIGGSWTLEMLSWTAFMAIVGWIGNAELAATNIVFQVLHFSFMGAVSLATAATTLVGQYLGADEIETAKKTARSTIRWGIIYCVSLGFVFLAARRQIVAVFNTDPAVIDVGARLFVYAAVFQFFDGLGISSNGVIRGAGDTRWPMVVMALLAWVIFVPLTYILARTMDLGVDGAWAAATIFIASVGTSIYLRQRSGRWMSMRV